MGSHGDEYIINSGHWVSILDDQFIEVSVIDYHSWGEFFTISFLGYDDHRGSPGAIGFANDSIFFHVLEFFLEPVDVLILDSIGSLFDGSGISCINVMIVLGLGSFDVLEIIGEDILIAHTELVYLFFLLFSQSFTKLVDMLVDVEVLLVVGGGDLLGGRSYSEKSSGSKTLISSNQFWNIVNLFKLSLKDLVENNLCTALSLLDGDWSNF